MSNRYYDYITEAERLATELNREPTDEEVENAMIDREAEEIDAAYEQARADGQITFDK